ncbi:hypothetical protein EJB05_16031 [Eragrostis curvula]|uniref:Exostosin GT47 domain-containing protein n=1 Tax=Eragrostis curvula TaxID=38414 RepID=A0A5J9VGY4_9POAL|nr:hypothetical protein EJB05_16031 [Eragrostis curvula]
MGGSRVHRLIEQGILLTTGFGLISLRLNHRLLKSVVRVLRQEEADIFYVPFFTTISLLEKQECKALYREALKWVTDQHAWQHSEGRDHVIPVHHPWSFKSVQRLVKKTIWLLPDMDSTGNWYKPGQVYVEKDVIPPYVPSVDLCDSKCGSGTRSKRNLLLFFRGRLNRNAGGKIHSKLVAGLKGVEYIVIEEGSAGAVGKIGLFVSSSDAVQPGWLVKYLRGIDAKRVNEMQSDLVKTLLVFKPCSASWTRGPYIENVCGKRVKGLMYMGVYSWEHHKKALNYCP